MCVFPYILSIYFFCLQTQIHQQLELLIIGSIEKLIQFVFNQTKMQRTNIIFLKMLFYFYKTKKQKL